MATIRAVRDRSTITREIARAELRIPASVSNSTLDRWLAAAKEQADAFLANPFVELDPDTLDPLDPIVEVTIPAAVEEGILEAIRCRYQATTVAPGVASESVGNLSRSYTANATAGDWYATARELWQPFRIWPGL
jgi:hypothetical protein